MQSLLVVLACLAVAAVANTRSPHDTRIIAGSPHSSFQTTFGSQNLKWQVLVISTASGQSIGCGGSIVDKNWIITAAHCVRTLQSCGNDLNRPASGFSIYTGNTGSSPGSSGGNVYGVDSTYVHSTYSSCTNAQNRVDIAMLKLSTNITYGSTVGPIDLPAAAAGGTGCETSGIEYVASGYGNTVSPVNSQPSTPSQTAILWVKQRYFPAFPQTGGGSSACGQAQFPLPDKAFCTQYVSCGTSINCADTCTGDSGGPVAQQTPATPTGWTLCGVTQSGTVSSNDANKALCGNTGQMGIYTSVQQNRLNFIDPVMQGLTGPTDNTQGGSSSSSLFCFHERSLISYKGSKEVTLATIEKGEFAECLIPHKFVADGVSINTDCHKEPLRLSNNHLVFSKTHGLVEAHKLRTGDLVFADVDEKKVCKVLSTKKDPQQTYMGLNCRESVVLANGVKCSTFESQHTIPYLWMKYMPSVIGLKQASVVGEFLSNVFRKVGLA